MKSIIIVDSFCQEPKIEKCRPSGCLTQLLEHGISTWEAGWVFHLHVCVKCKKGLMVDNCFAIELIVKDCDAMVLFAYRAAK